MLLFLVGGSKAFATDVPYNVGTDITAGYMSAASDELTLAGDGTVEFTFTNHCGTGNFWENWHFICGNESDSYTAGDNNTNRYFVMRADRWDGKAGSASGFKVDPTYFTDFMTYQNEATVNVKAVRLGTTVNVYTTITKGDVEHTMDLVKTGVSGTIKFYLTGSLSYLEVTKQSVKNSVDAGTVFTNAYITFDGATISNRTVAGEISTMTWSGEWTDTPSITDNMFRIGNMNAGLVAVAGEKAGAKDKVEITFDLGLVGLTQRTTQFIVNDINGLVLVDESFQIYNQTFSANTLGFDISKFAYKNGDNPGMTNDTKNTITLTFDYATRKISGKIVNKNGTFTKETCLTLLLL